MLPLTLLALVQVQLAYAQQTPLLQPDIIQSYTGTTVPKSSVFTLPDSRFFVTNDTTITLPGPDTLGDPNVYEISLQSGYGAWTGIASNGGYLAVSNPGQTPFEVGVSDEGPMHTWTDSPGDLPLFGDSTSNQVLLFSPPIASSPNPNTLTYPNYTLPAANLSYPDFGPSIPKNVTLVVAPTSSSSALASLPRTGCALRAVTADGVRQIGPKQSDGLWLKDGNGWRWQWALGGLNPQTNYTVYSITNQTYVSGPINFVTKSASFSCPIVHSLPYCPSINYAVPITRPSSSDGVHDASTLPAGVVNPLLQVLTNFTVSLTTFPCGRDEYSPLVTCEDCQQAYRKWLCAVWFPRCSEEAPAAPDQSQAQKPISALQAVAPSATPRSPGLSPFPSGYSTLLPCLETCTAVDRACPYFVGFKCPVPRFNAASSYGVGYIDSGKEGVQGGGVTGTAQDIYGNVWCNDG